MSRTPSISVVVPTYNPQDFLQATIASVDSQTITPDEVIIIDDGSETPVGPLASLNLPQLKVIRTEHGGLSSAWNHALRHAQGEWVAFLDHDDLWHPMKLERQIERAGAGVDVIFCQRQKFLSETGAPIFTPAYLAEFCENPALSLLKSFFATPSTILIRKTLLHSVAGFDSALASSADYDMWIRLALQGARFDLVDEVLVSKRISASSIQGQQELGAKSEYLLRALEKNRPAMRRFLGLSDDEWSLRMGFNLGFFLAAIESQSEDSSLHTLQEQIGRYGMAARYAAALRTQHAPLCERPWYPETTWTQLGFPGLPINE